MFYSKYSASVILPWFSVSATWRVRDWYWGIAREVYTGAAVSLHMGPVMMARNISCVTK